MKPNKQRLQQQKAKLKTSGYAKDKKKLIALNTPIKLVHKVQTKPARKLIPGIGDALTAMSELSKYLVSCGFHRKEFNVSIEMLEDRWILLVRGRNPYLDYYGNYEVKHLDSTLIYNPEAK